MKKFQRLRYTFKKELTLVVIAPSDLQPERAEQLAKAYIKDELEVDETAWDYKMFSTVVAIPAKDRQDPAHFDYVTDDRYHRIVPPDFADWWRATADEVESEPVEEEPDPNQLNLFEMT